jgi:diguanylate cyclase (GGDEF)-like protein
MRAHDAAAAGRDGPPRATPFVVGGRDLAAIPEPAFASDTETGRIVGWNDAATRLLGIDAPAALMTTCAEVLHGVDLTGTAVCRGSCPYRRVAAAAPGASITATTGSWAPHPDVVCRAQSGDVSLSVSTLAALIDGRPAMLHLLRPAPASRIDGLTGCLTRAAFAEILPVEGARCRRRGRPIAVALADADGLARLNHDHGHDAGDEMLRSMAAALSEGRAGDVVCRWGGDEFAVLLPETDVVAARRRLHRALDRLRVHGAAAGRAWSFCCGVAPLGADCDAEVALSGAETALYIARRQGPARLCLLPRSVPDGM